MLNRLYNVFRDRTVQVVIATSYMALLTALTAYLLHDFRVRPLPLIAIEVVLASTLALLVERATNSARGIALLTSNDLKISLLASGTFLILGIYFLFQQPSAIVRPVQGIVPPIAATVLYAGSGILLGSSLRSLVASLIIRALFGRPRFFTTLCLISLWFLSAGIALLPGHLNSMPPFMLGLALGVSLHKGFALRLTRSAAAYRRLFEVQSAIPDNIRLSRNERTALELLAEGRNPITKTFKKLRAHIHACQEHREMTPRLYLISACAWRLEGRYADAINDTQIANNPPQDILDAQLLLIRALSLEDRGDYVDGEIDGILKVLTSTPPGRSCPLTRALQARRTAERCIDDSRGIIRFEKYSLVSVVASLDLRRRTGAALEQTQVGVIDEATEFFRGFVAHGVPVTPSWLLDVFGYSLLVAGCPEEARVFLQRCIALDPDYSYGYLHLGDYFLFRRTGTSVGGQMAAPGKAGTWHAQACYLLAERMERNKASRVGRIARGRLRLIERLNEPRMAAR